VLVAATFGDTDMNFSEAAELWKLHPKKSRKFVAVFKGGHEWSPAENFEQAMDWFEEQAFLEKPMEQKPCNFLSASDSSHAGKKIAGEPLSPEAYKWYFDLLKSRLEKADDKFGNIC